MYKHIFPISIISNNIDNLVVKAKMVLLNQSIVLTRFMMKARYRNTVAGFIWVLLNPIIMFGAQSLAFKKFLRLDIENYHLFLTSNLIPWIFLITNLQMCTTVFEEKSSILKSYQVNPSIFILSQIFDNFFNFVCTFILLLIPVFFSSDVEYIGLLCLPLALATLFLGSTILSSFVAFSQVFYKDVKFIVQFLTSVIFFVTPVFYPIKFVPEMYRPFIEFNIFYVLIRPINICLYNFDLTTFWISIGKSAIACMFLGLCFYFVWRKKRNEFYLNI